MPEKTGGLSVRLDHSSLSPPYREFVPVAARMKIEEEDDDNNKSNNSDSNSPSSDEDEDTLTSKLRGNALLLFIIK